MTQALELLACPECTGSGLHCRSAYVMNSSAHWVCHDNTTRPMPRKLPGSCGSVAAQVEHNIKVITPTLDTRSCRIMAWYAHCQVSCTQWMPLRLVAALLADCNACLHCIAHAQRCTGPACNAAGEQLAPLLPACSAAAHRIRCAERAYSQPVVCKPCNNLCKVHALPTAAHNAVAQHSCSAPQLVTLV